MESERLSDAEIVAIRDGERLRTYKLPMWQQGPSDLVRIATECLARGRRIAELEDQIKQMQATRDDLLSPTWPAGVRHGVNCPKVEHDGGEYYHGADDDKPYMDPDDVMHCGRCHRNID